MNLPRLNFTSDEWIMIGWVVFCGLFALGMGYLIANTTRPLLAKANAALDRFNSADILLVRCVNPNENTVNYLSDPSFYISPEIGDSNP